MNKILSGKKWNLSEPACNWCRLHKRFNRTNRSRTTKPSFDNICRIATALDIHPADLFLRNASSTVKHTKSILKQNIYAAQNNFDECKFVFDSIMNGTIKPVVTNSIFMKIIRFHWSFKNELKKIILWYMYIRYICIYYTSFLYKK